LSQQQTSKKVEGELMNKHIIVVILALVCVYSNYIYCANKIKVISVEELRTIQTDFGFEDNYLLIDITSPEVYKREHIAEAINIPESEMKIKIQELPLDKLIITYCHCGADASTAKFAADKLKKLGYKNVFYLSEPFIKYKNAGYPVFADLTRAATNLHIVSDVVSGINNQMVSIEILHSRILYHPEEINTNFYIIDLRAQEEYEKGHIQGALNIQPAELFEKTTAGGVTYERFSKEKEIFFYGKADDARNVVEELYRISYKVAYYLSGDYDDWTELLE